MRPHNEAFGDIRPNLFEYEQIPPNALYDKCYFRLAATHRVLVCVQPNLADKVERCMDEKFLPFAKHKGSQITNWFQQVCAKEALAFEN